MFIYNEETGNIYNPSPLVYFTFCRLKQILVHFFARLVMIPLMSLPSCSAFSIVFASE